MELLIHVPFSQARTTLGPVTKTVTSTTTSATPQVVPVTRSVLTPKLIEDPQFQAEFTRFAQEKQTEVVNSTMQEILDYAKEKQRHDFITAVHKAFKETVKIAVGGVRTANGLFRSLTAEQISGREGPINQILSSTRNIEATLLADLQKKQDEVFEFAKAQEEQRLIEPPPPGTVDIKLPAPETVVPQPVAEEPSQPLPAPKKSEEPTVAAGPSPAPKKSEEPPVPSGRSPAQKKSDEPPVAAVPVPYKKTGNPVSFSLTTNKRNAPEPVFNKVKKTKKKNKDKNKK